MSSRPSASDFVSTIQLISPKMVKCYYKILGISKNATPDEVKNAWRQLVFKHHPDRNPDDKDATSKLQEINEAYEVLSDPHKRAMYDLYESDWKYMQKLSQRGHDFYSDLKLSIKVAAKCHYHTFDGHAGEIRLWIPSGVYEGQRLRYHGMGGLGKNGGPNGDFVVTFHIILEPGWKIVDKKNIYATTPVDVYIALLGGEILVNTLDGKLKVKINPETQTGTQLRLPGQGYPAYENAAPRGDFYVVVEVRLPNNLKAEEKQLITKLASIRI